MLEDSRVIEREIELGRLRISRCARRLSDVAEAKALSKLLFQELYPQAEDYLKQARHGNPIHHTPQVVEFLLQMVLNDLVMFEKVKVLAVAGIFHDTGFAKIPSTPNPTPDQKKITKQMIDDCPNPEEKEKKRKKAIWQRQEHAKYSAEIALPIIKATNSFSSSEIETIEKIIINHDNPSIAELIDNPGEKKRWLFGPELGISVLLRMHREADRLWMLTIEGIIADLERHLGSGKVKSVRQQIKDNVKRHNEELMLYQNAFSEGELRCFGFKPGCAFFTNPIGQELFLTLQEETDQAFVSIGSSLVRMLGLPFIA